MNISDIEKINDNSLIKIIGFYIAAMSVVTIVRFFKNSRVGYAFLVPSQKHAPPPYPWVLPGMALASPAIIIPPYIPYYLAHILHIYNIYT